MTVSNSTARNDYLGNGVTTAFTVSFRFLANSHLRVLRTVVATNTTTELILNSLGPDGFSVIGANQPSGGTVTVITAPAVGERLSILRNMPFTQLIDYIANDPFPAESHERGLDERTMENGQLREVVSRSITLPPATTGVSTDLPGPEALKLLRWKADLTGLENATPPEIATVAPGSVVDATVSPIAAIQSSKLSFLQSGAGALAVSVQSELRQHISVKQFGAVADGVTNDSAAFQAAAVEALARGYGCVHIPAGTYRLQTKITVAMTGQSGLSFSGDGEELTTLIFDTASGDGFDISSPSGNWWINVTPHNRVAFNGLTIATTKTNIGTAILLNMGSLEGRPAPGVSISNITIRGHDGFTDYFAKGVDLLDTADVDVNNVRVVQGGPGNLNGFGFDIRASGPTTDPTNIKFTNCEVVFGNIAYRAGDHVEGIYMTQCDGINVNRYLVWNSAAESGLHVVGGHSNCFERNFDLAGMFDGSITGHLAYKNGVSATFRNITMDNCGSLCITGNQFRGGAVGGEIGIDISNASADPSHGIVIADNHFSNTDLAIRLQATTARVEIGHNQFLSVNQRVSDLGTGNSVHRRLRAASSVVSLVGGAVTELVDVAIPTGYYLAKPTVAYITSETEDMLGVYQFEAVQSTAINARFKVWKRDGTNITAGNHRFSLSMFE